MIFITLAVFTKNNIGGRSHPHGAGSPISRRFGQMFKSGMAMLSYLGQQIKRQIMSEKMLVRPNRRE